MKEKICRTCGEAYPPTIDYFYRKGCSGLSPNCIPCDKEERRLKWLEEADRQNCKRRERYRKQCGEGGKGFVYTVISDPLQDGGFRPGATLPSQQVKMGVEMGCFASGMILKSRTKKYRVSGRRLVEMTG